MNNRSTAETPPHGGTWHNPQWFEHYRPNHTFDFTEAKKDSELGTIYVGNVRRLNPNDDFDFGIIWFRIKESTKTQRGNPNYLPFAERKRIL